MTYNMTIIADNSTTLLGLVKSTNEVLLEGMFGPLILFGIFAVLLLGIYFSSGSVKKSMIGASFIVTILGFMLAAVGLLSGLGCFICAIVFSATLALTWNLD